MIRKSLTCIIFIFLGSVLFGLKIEHVFGKNLSELGGTFVFMFNNFLNFDLKIGADVVSLRCLGNLFQRVGPW